MRSQVSSSPFARECAGAFLRRSGACLLLARLLSPTEMGLVLPRVGTMRLRLAYLDPEDAALVPRGGPGVEVFEGGETDGPAVVIESTFARHLVDRLLGRPLAPLPSPLSRIERGLLAGLVVVASSRLGLCLGIDAKANAASPSQLDRQGLCLRLSMAIAEHEGLVWLHASQSCVERCLRNAPAWARIASTQLRFELARTEVPRADALAAAVGDVVAFDETRAISAASPLALSLGHGQSQKRVGVVLGSDGCFRPDPRGDPTVPLDASAGECAERTQVVAEVGGWREAAAEPGTSAADPSPLTCARILLRLGEVDWAEGQPCDLAGRLGVRLTRKLSD